MPPALTRNVTVVALVVAPLVISRVPPLIVVATAVPPDITYSNPPLSRTVPLARPPP